MFLYLSNLKGKKRYGTFQPKNHLRMSKEKHPNPQLVLRESKTVVVVGCSADPYRTSNYAAHYLQKKGIELFP